MENFEISDTKNTKKSSKCKDEQYNWVSQDNIINKLQNSISSLFDKLNIELEEVETELRFFENKNNCQIEEDLFIDGSLIKLEPFTFVNNGKIEQIVSNFTDDKVINENMFINIDPNLSCKDKRI